MASNSRARKRTASVPRPTPAEKKQTQAAPPAATQAEPGDGGADTGFFQADLNALPSRAQGALYEYFLGHTQTETIEWLAKKGIDTTPSALRLFHLNYTTREQLLRAEAITGIITEEVARQIPALAPERIRELGQFLFTRLAIEKKDVVSWKITQDLEMKRSKLDLDWEKFLTQSAKTEVEPGVHKKLGGLTPETSEIIEREIKLF